MSGKGKPQQNPGETSLILKYIQFCAYYLSRNFFVTNQCLNLGQERVRRICRDLETRGDCSEYSCIVNLAFRFLAQQLERDATNMIRRAENAMRTKWANTNNAFKLGVFLKMVSHRQNKGRELARALGLEICCRPI